MIGSSVPLALAFDRPEALILLVLAIPILLAYLVDPLRRRSHDPFAFLWASLAAPRPWLGRLSRYTEVLLVLSALVLLVAAVADPGSRVRRPPARFLVLALVDPGDSWDERGWTAARAEVGRRLETVGPEETACVLVGGSDGVRVAMAPSRGPLSAALLSSLPRSSGAPDRAALVRDVARLVARHEGAEVVWCDAAPPPGLPDAWTVQGPQSPAGAPPPYFSLARREDGALSVELVNRASAAWSGALRLRSGGAVRALASVDLEARRTETVAVRLRPADVGELVVELVPAGETEPIARAGHYRPPRRPLRVLVIAPGGRAPFFETLLAKLSDRLDPTGTRVVDAEAAREVLAGRAGTRGGPDLVVFLEAPGPEWTVTAPALIFGGPGTLGTRHPGTPDPGGISTWERDHPLLAWVDFSPVVAEEVFAVEPAPGVQVLATGPAGPMLLYRHGPPPALAFPFRLERSNLVLEWAFSTLVSNLLRAWGREATELGPFPVGTAFPLPAGSERVTVARPGEAGPLWRGRAGEGFAFRPREPGRYALSSDDGEAQAWFNPVAAEPEAAPGVAGVRPRATEAPESGSPWWRSVARVVVWFAVGVLLLEWTLYSRGAS